MLIYIGSVPVVPVPYVLGSGLLLPDQTAVDKRGTRTISGHGATNHRHDVFLHQQEVSIMSGTQQIWSPLFDLV